MFYSLLPIPTEECAPSPFPNNISPYRASGIVMSLQLRTEQDVKNEDLGNTVSNMLWAEGFRSRKIVILLSGMWWWESRHRYTDGKSCLSGSGTASVSAVLFSRAVKARVQCESSMVLVNI